MASCQSHVHRQQSLLDESYLLFESTDSKAREIAQCIPGQNRGGSTGDLLGRRGSSKDLYRRFLYTGTILKDRLSCTTMQCHIMEFIDT